MTDWKARFDILRVVAAGKSRDLLPSASESGAQLGVGRVVRTGVGTYGLLVDVPGRGETKCICAQRLQGSPFGYSDTDLPIEGSDVLVVVGADTLDIGYVIGTVDRPDPNSADESLPQLAVSEVPDSPSRDTERIYTEAGANEKARGIERSRHRPADVFPGEFVRVNELGVGVDCDTLSARLRGGTARVTASFADGTVEIVSRNFRSYDGGGFETLVVDSGLSTRESAFSPYFGERRGGTGRKAPRKTRNRESDDDSRPVGRYRVRTYEGYLGGMFSRFLSRPEGCTDEVSDETGLRTDADKEPKDVGLMQLSVNDSGRLMFRSAGGFALERSDMIPVPVRVRGASDPEGMDPEDIDFKDELPFDVPVDGDGNRSPHYAILALADRQAYEYRQTYERFLEFTTDSAGSGEDGEGSGGSGSGKSDFYVRDEDEIYEGDEMPRDDVGIPGRKVARDDLEHNTGRRASLLFPPDGSIVMRDAWGSEVVFSGGNITFNTPGSILLCPGRSVIGLAGDDIVLKARNSVDVHATTHDVSIVGTRAVKVVGGSDESTNGGGVLIESLSNAVDMDPGAGSGEEAVFTGVTIRAPNSHVTAMGFRATVGANEELRIVTGKGTSAEREGRVVVSTGQFGVSASDGATIATKAGGLIATQDSVLLAGGSVAVAAKDSVMFATSSQVGVPIWLDCKFDFATTYVKFLSDYCTREQADSRNVPLKMGGIEDLLFTYRTSKQCGTLKGLELTDTAEQFTLYQPFWTIMADLGVGTLEDAETTMWEDATIDGEYPWPGTDAHNKGKYARIVREDGEPTTNTKVVEVRGKNLDGEDVIKKVLCSEKFDNIKGEAGSGEIKVELVDLDEYVVSDPDASED